MNINIRRAEHGMVSVEWALTVPVFIMCVLVCVGAVFYSNNVATTSYAAREAARSYSLGRGTDASINIVHKIAGAQAQVHIEEDGRSCDCER